MMSRVACNCFNALLYGLVVKFVALSLFRMLATFLPVDLGIGKIADGGIGKTLDGPGLKRMSNLFFCWMIGTEGS